MTTSIMDAHAARLDDPQSTAQRLPLQQRDRVRQCSGDGWSRICRPIPDRHRARIAGGQLRGAGSRVPA